MPSFSAKSRPVVAIVVFPDTKLLDVTGPLQVFADSVVCGGVAYDTVILSENGGIIQSDAGIDLTTQAMADWHGKDIQTLLISGGWGAQAAARNSAITENVAILARTAMRVGSVCTGAHILAASGLLDGRRASTHWHSCDELTRTYPQVTVEPDQIFVKDGKVWTSAGVTAGIDMCLAMVAEDSGRKTALRLARALVVYMIRPGGQSQFSPALVGQLNDTSGRFEALHSWMQDNLHLDLRVTQMAEFAGMSERNFARAYREETGRTPAKAVEMFRLAAARDLLEETMMPVASIARKTGFGDDERLRRAMHRAIGVSPAEYRDRFGMDSGGAGQGVGL
ncbi:MAG: GlxA family transcriptional regulator [Paracoccaceae bacterium]